MIQRPRAKLAWILVGASAAMGVALFNAEAETSPQSSVPESAQAEGKPATDSPQASSSPRADSSQRSEDRASSSANGCLVDPAAIEDLRQRRAEVDSKGKGLAAREAELKGREQALEEEFKKLVELRDRIEKSQGTLKKENEEKVAKVVETLETMNPKSAAALMATLDDSLAVVAMTRLTTPKLAKIMNLLAPERSAQLTENMTGYMNMTTKGGKNVGPQVKSQPNQPANAGI